MAFDFNKIKKTRKSQNAEAEETMAKIRHDAIMASLPHHYVNHSVGSDCYPFEIIDVLSPTRLVIREMDVLHYNEYGDCSRENIVSNERNRPIIIRKNRGARRGWHKEGENSKWSHYYLADEPAAYRDPNF